MEDMRNSLKIGALAVLMLAPSLMAAPYLNLGVNGGTAITVAPGQTFDLTVSLVKNGTEAMSVAGFDLYLNEPTSAGFAIMNRVIGTTSNRLSDPLAYTLSEACGGDPDCMADPVGAGIDPALIAAGWLNESPQNKLSPSNAKDLGLQRAASLNQTATVLLQTITLKAPGTAGVFTIGATDSSKWSDAVSLFAFFSAHHQRLAQLPYLHLVDGKRDCRINVFHVEL